MAGHNRLQFHPQGSFFLKRKSTPITHSEWHTRTRRRTPSLNPGRLTFKEVSIYRQNAHLSKYTWAGFTAIPFLEWNKPPISNHNTQITGVKLQSNTVAQSNFSFPSLTSLLSLKNRRQITLLTDMAGVHIAFATGD